MCNRHWKLGTYTYDNRLQVYGYKLQVYCIRLNVYDNRLQVYGNKLQVYSNKLQVYGNKLQVYGNRLNVYGTHYDCDVCNSLNLDHETVAQMFMLILKRWVKEKNSAGRR